ncbi:MAG TPA: hemolysin III family protein [Thermoanaerobaculia bacterium]|jgi:hemolysin III|nr:hemolysin III family protein [Thermoanaerobaculia bacterium]
MERIRRPLTAGEELANSVTHGIGLILSLIGFPLLLLAASGRKDPWQLVGYGVFATSLIFLYGISTLYHSAKPGRAKQILRVLDHSAIYLLIAGTYTPFTLGVLRGAWGWTLLGLIWGLAVFGILFKSLIGIRLPRASIVLYVLMGWLAVIAIRPLAAQHDGAALHWLLAGGILYTAGVVFYTWERLRYHHMLWHLFVLGGSVCHFLAVLWYSAPAV